ncbi:Hsp20 family protein [Methylocella sp.]|uniref:Hsp20 family protein n=1 Tax=Methylocella sp. TaxID=1978226 RepID=UPI003784DE7D
MPRGSASHIPFVLGFRTIERSRPASGKPVSDGYPPYNIERAVGGDGRPRLRLVIAVAGFSAAQIEILEQNGQIVVRGRHKDERGREHLHRGIAARQFQRVFLLGEAMRVESAALDRGLLSIDLAPADED